MTPNRSAESKSLEERNCFSRDLHSCWAEVRYLTVDRVSIRAYRRNVWRCCLFENSGHPV